MARFPFGFPDGWFPVAYSDELTSTDVRRLRYFDRELVLFRGEDGKAVLLDAYCPHLGAHLGVGGRVDGCHLVCPFHGWHFDASGSCVEIPGSAEIPSGAQTRSWPLVERNGILLAWHHGERRAPDCEVPMFPEWSAADWTTSYVRRSWIVRTHPQEVLENSVDWEHFQTVHGMPAPQDRHETFEGKTFRWVVGRSRTSRPRSASREEDCLVDSLHLGLGFGWLRYNGMYRTIVASGVTPIDHETVEIRLGVFGRRDGRSDAATREGLEAYIEGQASAMEQDLPIWESKCYQARPVLGDADSTIVAFRRWAGQLYSGPEAAPSAVGREARDA
jgi:phenylpropionate dioxygenase-like ring-hydroxylating dioxygenase large terminal subunit